MHTEDSKLKPWQAGSAELISYALNYLDSDSELERRIGYLLLDVGVEELLKTYLELPAEISGSSLPYPKHKEALESNSFIKVVRTVKETAKSKLSGFDILELQYFHERRNSLYHEGRGIIVQKEIFRKYAEQATEILFLLMDVDLRDQLKLAEQRLAHDKEISRIKERIDERLSEIERLLRIADELIFLVLERADPSLVLPSFWREYDKWQEAFDFDKVLSYYRAIRDSENHSVQDEKLEEALQIEPNFYQLMPTPLLRLAERYDVPLSLLVYSVEFSRTEFLLNLFTTVYSFDPNLVRAYVAANILLSDPYGGRFHEPEFSSLEILEKQNTACQEEVQELGKLIEELRRLSSI